MEQSRGPSVCAVVVGPGALGCLIAGLLAEAGHEVRLLDKDAERARALTRNGIVIENGSGSRRIGVSASHSPGDLGRPNLVCLCVKSYDTQAALQHARSLFTAETAVLSLQNGLGNVELISALVQPHMVVCGATAQGSTALGVGHVRHAGTGPTKIAPLSAGIRQPAERLAELLRSAGMATSVANDYLTVLWSKLVVNSAINPLTAVLGVANGHLLTDSDARRTLHAAAVETAAVARANGIALPFDDPIAQVEEVCRNTSDNFSSMLQDVRRKKRTEIEAITGAVVRQAESTEVPVPVNESLLAQIRQLEAEYRET